MSPYSLGGPASPARRMNQYAASPLSVFAYDPRGNTRSESAHCRGDIFPRQPNGDIGDHRVNSSDLTRLLGQFSQPVTPENAECDINDDGQIGTSDLILLLGNLGNGCDWAEYAYDWADRLVEVKLSSFENGSAANPPRVEVHRYEYDALGRRIARTLFASGSVGSGVPQARCTRFIHGGVGTAADAVVGWQVLEEQDGTGETLATFVPSGRSGAVDEVVCFERDLIGSGLIENLGMAPTEPACGPPAPVAEDRREYWLHRDDQFSTTSVSDAQGQVVERYEYHDYGFPLILSAAGEPLGLNAQGLYASRVGNASLFTGREWDGESKLYHYRTRAYHPGLGRFMQIDRIGVWGDEANLGNAFAGLAGNPLRWLDPFGEYVDVTIFRKNENQVIIVRSVYDGPKFDPSKYNAQASSHTVVNIRADETAALDAHITDAELANAFGTVAEAAREAAADSYGPSAAALAVVCRVPLTGQQHHIVATKIGREAIKNPNLASIVKHRNLLITQAANKMAHRGYQRWHRELDDEVVEWLRKNEDATIDQFLAYLRRLYRRPDLKRRFPNGVPKINGGC